MSAFMLLLVVGADPVVFDVGAPVTNIGASESILAALDDTNTLTTWTVKGRRKIASKEVVANDIDVFATTVAVISNTQTTLFTHDLKPSLVIAQGGAFVSLRRGLVIAGDFGVMRLNVKTGETLLHVDVSEKPVKCAVTFNHSVYMGYADGTIQEYDTLLNKVVATHKPFTRLDWLVAGHTDEPLRASGNTGTFCYDSEGNEKKVGPPAIPLSRGNILVHSHVNEYYPNWRPLKTIMRVPGVAVDAVHNGKHAFVAYGSRVIEFVP